MISYFKSKDLELQPEHLDIIKKFSSFAFEFLKIQTPLRINLISKSFRDIQSTGSYFPDHKYFNVLCEGRSCVDILRTIAHEMVHHSQNEQNRIPDNPKNIGGFIENEANIFAGALIKIFVQVFNIKDLYLL